MPANADNRLAAFSPELAVAIARFVKEEVAKHARGVTPVGGRVPATDHCLAKIVSSAESAGVHKHEWKEVRWDFAGSALEDVPEGRGGTTAENYVAHYEGDELDVGTVHLVSRQTDPDTGANVWLATDAGLGTGIKDIRWANREDWKGIQATYVDDPEESDWVDKVTFFEQCNPPA